MTTTELLTKAEDAARSAGKWLIWDREYKRMRATHTPREAALLALCFPQVGLAKVADQLTQESAHADRQ